MLISHPCDNDAEAIPLVRHLFNVGDACRTAVRNMHLDLTLISGEMLERLTFLIGIFHDFGKATTFFQNYIREPETADKQFTRHSFVSAATAYRFVKQELGSGSWAYVAFQVIQRHHGDLRDFDQSDDRDLIRSNLNLARIQLDNILKYNDEPLTDFYSEHIGNFHTVRSFDFDGLKEAMEESDDFSDDFFETVDGEMGSGERIERFFIVNLLFSLLIDHDKKDAARLETDYFRGNLEEPPNDVFAYIDQLRKKYPARFSKEIPINRLRTEFLEEIAGNPDIKPGNHFYTVTAPTGIGKTFGCLAFANRLKTMLPVGTGRIIYCLPYTSIIDQNHREFEKVADYIKGDRFRRRPARYLMRHHHLTSKAFRKTPNDETYGYRDYREDALLVESWESAMMVTTFVQFFHTVIGYSNRNLKKFHNIVNSVVILDEVQNINPEYYRLLKRVLHVLGKRFNIYFLLVTATQPEILDKTKSSPISLVESDRYMGHPLFNRVTLAYESETQTLDEFKEYFTRTFDGSNGLIVMNTKGSAVEMYRYIKGYIRENKQDYRVYSLTTNQVPLHRRQKIAEIKAALEAGERIIVISTQLIEAGVDLSFRRVYRDYGPLDSIIQAAGRCNRNGEYGPLGGHMTLVEIVDENNRRKPYHGYVYKPVIAQMVRRVLTGAGYQAKEFETLSRAYFQQFDFELESRRLLDAVKDLNYDMKTEDQTPVKDFQLIEKYDDETIYILVTPKAQETMERLLSHLSELMGDEVSEERRDVLRLEVENLKAEIKDYQLSLRSDELKSYEHSDIIKGEGGFYKYITYEDQSAYAYDVATGFLKEPKRQLSGAVFF